MKTAEATVAKTIHDLINDHAQHCDADIPQFMGMTDGSEANLVSVAQEASNKVRVRLDDGSNFIITVTRGLS